MSIPWVLPAAVFSIAIPSVCILRWPTCPFWLAESACCLLIGVAWIGYTCGLDSHLPATQQLGCILATPPFLYLLWINHVEHPKPTL